MNKKGFTLIELVAIIAVLAAILLVSFPSLLATAEKDDKKEYEEMVETICLSGESYIYSNTHKYDQLTQIGSIISIDVEELVHYGNVNGNIKNSKTNATILNDSLEYTVLDDYSLKCDYID